MERLLAHSNSTAHTKIDSVASRHAQEELRAGEEIARCPSCSLYITVIYEPVSSRQFSIVIGPCRFLRTSLFYCLKRFRNLVMRPEFVCEMRILEK